MKIALISGSRSDRNALVMVEKALKTGGHQVAWMDLHGPLDNEFTYGTPELRAAEATKITGFALWDGSEDKLGADLVVLHGDRHEILGAALAANLMQVPITHIGGGDITEGSQDDAFRHAISKLSHLHFASNQDSADRIVQMGEEPDRVHVTGCPGIDMVMATPTLGRDETFSAVGLATPARSLLVLLHPNTLSDTGPELKALSDALMSRTEALVLLGPNADAGSELIRNEWKRLVALASEKTPKTSPLASDFGDLRDVETQRKLRGWVELNMGTRVVYRDNVEPQVFYSLLKWCDVLVGNSSAGFYEAPCFSIPVINIGDRQKGRLGHANLYHSAPTLESISELIDSRISFAKKYHDLKNPYGDGHASERIAKVIGGIKNPRALLRKKFHQRRLMESWETAI